MRQLFIALLSLISTSLLAQTKEIAFKSHSGNMDNFHIALENILFSNEESNFGLPADIKTYHLDSVIYISKTTAVVVRKVYSRGFNEPKDSARFMWVNKDTVINDPLFARKHSLDSIRNILKATGRYTNPVNEVVFIGYDNKKSKEKKKDKDEKKDNSNENNMIPAFIMDSNNNSPFDMQLVLMLGTILLLSFIGGWVSWKFYQPRLQKA